MKLLKFLKSKLFLRNLLIMVLLTFALIWVILKMLNLFTLHGQTINVPDFTGLTMQELQATPDSRNFEFIIIDSIHDNTKQKGSIYAQDPLPDSKVKKGRKIYLTLVAMLPEQVSMPDLKDLTLRQAMAMLETYGLKLGKLDYVPDIARNAVLEQKYTGRDIEPGTMILKGSEIDLVVGEGLTGERVKAPYLFGMSRDEALYALHEASLNVGAEFFENVKDTSEAKVYKQSPVYTDRAWMKSAQSVDLWFTTDKYFDFRQTPDTIARANEEI